MTTELLSCLIPREFLNLSLGLTGGKGVKGVNGPQETDWIKVKCSSSNPEMNLVGGGTAVVSISQCVHQRKDLLFVHGAGGGWVRLPALLEEYQELRKCETQQ